MSQFDIDTYLLNRVGGESGIADKLDQIDRASAHKKQRLAAFQQSIAERTEQHRQQLAAEQRSWANRLGLDHGSIKGDIVNSAASLVTGVGRTAGDALTAAPDLIAMKMLSGIPQEALDAYQRKQAGQALAGDDAILNGDPSQYQGEERIGDDPVAFQGGYGARIENALNLQRGTKAMDDAFDWSSTVSQKDKAQLTGDLGENFQENYDRASVGIENLRGGNIVDGLKDLLPGATNLLVDGLAAVGSNPAALSQYVLENAPQLAIGMAKGGTAALAQTNIGYAAGTFAEGIRKYQEENGGALPSAEEIQEKAMQSLSLAAAEQAGDMLTLGAAKLGRGVKDAATNAKDALKNVGKGTTEAVEAAGEATESAARQQLKAALSKASEVVANSAPARALKATGDAVGGAASKVGKGISAVGDSAPGRVMKATAGGFASEAPTEAYQTYMEGEITGEKASPFDIYQGAVIGGASGGTLSGTINATAETAKAVVAAADKAAKAAEVRRAKANLEKNAVTTGDVTAFVDPKSEDFAPKRAIELLHKYSKAEGRTAAEKTEALNKSQGVLNTLDDQIAQYESELEANDPTKLKELVDRIDRTIADLGPDQDPADYQEWRDEEQKKLEALEKRLQDPAEAAKITERAEHSQAMLEQVTKLREESETAHGLLAQDTPQAQDTQALVDAIKAPVDSTADADTQKAAQATKQQAVEQILHMALGGNGLQLDAVAKDLDAIGKNWQAHGLTKEQGVMLQTFSAARLAYNAAQDTESVTKTVLDGDYSGAVKNMGITQYRNQMASAMRKGDKGSAQRLMLQLARWADSHSSKAQAMGEAMESDRVKAGGKVQVYPKGQQWQVNTGKAIPQDEFAKARGVVVSGGSHKLLDAIKKEAAAITAAQAELKMAYEAKFGGKKHVQDVSKQPVQQSKPQGAGQPAPKQPQATPASAGSSAGKAGAVGSSSARSGGSQSTGQAEPAVTATNSEKTSGVSDSAVETQETQKTEVAKPKETKAQRKRREARERHEAAQQPQTTQKTAVEESQKTQEQAAQAQRTQEQQELPSGDDSSGNVTDEDIPLSAYEEEAIFNADEDGESTAASDSTEDSANSVGENEDGILDAVVQKAENPEGKALSLPELRLGDLVTQSPGKDAQGNPQRPLVAIKNLMTQYLGGKVDFKKFVKFADSRDIAHKQQALLDRVANAVHKPEFIALLGKVLKSKPSEAQYRDPHTYLIEEDAEGNLTLPENVRTGLVAAMFSFVGDANKTAHLYNEDVNKMLGRDEDHPVTTKERNQINNHVPMGMMANSLGKRVVQALGLRMTEDAPSDFLAKMEVSLGNLAVKMMIEQGLLTTHTVASSTWEAMRKGEDFDPEVKVGKEDKYTTLYALKHDPETKEYSKAVEGMRKAVTETKDILGKVFGVETHKREPGFEPTKHTQKTTPTGMKVPARLNEIMQKMGERGWKTAGTRYAAWMQLGNPDNNMERWLDMAGWKDSGKVHIDQRESQDAKNEGIARDLELLESFLGEAFAAGGGGMDTDFYMQYEAWVQQRVGGKNNVANPQSNKIARWLLAMPKWQSEIPIEFDDQGNPANDKLVSFMLRVAEGLGVKTERQYLGKSIQAVHAKLAKPEVVEGLDAFKALVRGESLTPEQQDKIRDVVVAGGEKLHTFAALHAWAEFLVAQEDGAKSFTTMLAGEVDGVANGTMLNLMMYGGAELANLANQLEKGGIFVEPSTDEDGVEFGTEHTQYNEYRGEDDSRTDIYQDTVTTLKGYIAELVGKGGVFFGKKSYLAAFQAAESIIGDLSKERDIAKSAMNPMNFGAGMNKIRSGMANDFVDRIYDDIAKYANGDKPRSGKGDLEFSAYISQVNQLIQAGALMSMKKGDDQPPQVPLLPTVTPAKTLLEQRITPKQLAAIRKAFNKTMGQAMAGGTVWINGTKVPFPGILHKKFGEFLKRKNTSVHAANLTFGFYNAIYQERLRAKAIEKGIPFNKDGKPLWALTRKEERQIQKDLARIFPVMHTIGSQKSGRLDEGVLLAKRERGAGSYADSDVSSEFGMAGKHAAGVSSTAETYGFAEPGVLPTSASAHSLDSDTMHETLAEFEGLGVHDAIVIGVDDLQGAATALNHNLFNNLMAYNPARAAEDAMFRTLGGIVQLLDSGMLTPGEVQALRDAGQAMLAKNADTLQVSSVAELVNSIAVASENAANLAELQKNQIGEKATAFDQYAAAGGNYVVTPDDRKAATARKEAVIKRMDTVAMHGGLREAQRETLDKFIRLVGGSSTVDEAFTQIHNLKRNESIQLAQSTMSNLIGSAGVAVEEVLLAASYFMQQKGNGSVKLTEAIAREAKAAAKRDADAPIDDRHGLTASQLENRALTALVAQKAGISPDQWAADDNLNGAEGVENASYPPLQQFFENTAPNDLTAASVANALKKMLKDDKEIPNRQFLFALADRLRVLLPDDVPVVYITPSTPMRALNTWDGSRSAGARIPARDGRPEQVMIKGAEFRFSRVTPEVVLHELLHVALANALNKPLAEQTPQEKKLITQLNEIKDAAYLTATHRHMGQRFKEPFKNLHEFVSWGLTNVEFQQAVLSAPMKDALAAKMTFGKQLQAFFTAVSDWLFGKNSNAARASLLMAMTATAIELAESQDGAKSRIQAAGAKKKKANAARAKSRAQSSGGPIHHMALGTPKTRTYSTLDIHEALAQQSSLAPEFQAHLADLLHSIVNRLHGPFGSFKATLMQDQAGAPLDVWAKAQATGQLPFASEVTQVPGLAIADQSLFAIEQIEATVVAATTHSEVRASVAMGALNKLFNEAQERLSPKDFYSGNWATATPAEKAEAQAQYDFLFAIKPDATNRSRHLARFAALGLAHPKVAKALQFKTRKTEQTFAQAKTLAAKLQLAFEKLLELFQAKVTSTVLGEPADARLKSLVGQLVDIEAKYQHRLNAPEYLTDRIGKSIEQGGQKLMAKGRGLAKQVAQSNVIQGSKYATVQLAGKLVELAADQKLEQMGEQMASLRDQVVKGRNGMVAGLMNELRKPAQMITELIMSRKNEERIRQQIMDNTMKTVLSSFQNEGKNLTDAQKHALTQVMLRSGAHYLIEDYSTQDIERMLRDSTYADAEIARLEAQLPQRFKDAYIEQAKALAFYKQTGKNYHEYLMLNADNIAALHGLPVTVPENIQQTSSPIIAQLVALYSLRNTKDTDQAKFHTDMLEVLRSENSAGAENGVKFALLLHKQQEKHARETIFNGKPTLMEHGYLPEIYNPNVEVLPIEKSQLAEYQALGYELVHEMSPDPHDPDLVPRVLVRLKGGGLPPRVTGAFAFNAKVGKGSHNHSGFLNPNTVAGNYNLSNNVTIANKRRAMHHRKQPGYGQRFDPWSAPANHKQFMAPLLNEDGATVNWRYLMTADTKDRVLERANQFERLLGANAAATFDKEVSAQNNERVINALKDQYDAEYLDQAHRYVQVGPMSQDKAMREAWALLPEDTRKYAEKIWGRKGMMVRMDQFHAIFGYQKLTVATLFKDAYAQRRDNPGRTISELEDFKAWQKALVFSVEAMVKLHARAKLGMNEAEAQEYAKRTALIVSKAEKISAEIISEVKDFVVVKSGIVLAGNIWSNHLLLMMQGVPLRDSVRYYGEALRGVTKYQADTAELEKLVAQVETGFTQGKTPAIERRIAQLRSDIANNPVTEMINAGMLPTIVDDINTTEDPYSFKSELTKKMQAKLGKMPEGVQAAAKQVYMTHDTELYRMLSRTTQLSDFVARYALYQHLTTRKQDPMTKKEARLKAMESFIHYDIPMQPGLQYMDDHGLMMFTKYFLRVQRVIFNTMQENPARALSLMLLNNYMELGPIVQDSALIWRVGNNPFEPGVLQAVDAVGMAPAVAASMALLK